MGTIYSHIRSAFASQNNKKISRECHCEYRHIQYICWKKKIVATRTKVTCLRIEIRFTNFMMSV